MSQNWNTTAVCGADDPGHMAHLVLPSEYWRGGQNRHDPFIICWPGLHGEQGSMRPGSRRGTPPVHSWGVSHEYSVLVYNYTTQTHTCIHVSFSAHVKAASRKKGKGRPYSTTEHRVPELIPVLGSQPAGDVSHKPGGRLLLLSARPAVTSQPLTGLLPVSLRGEQRHDGCE